MKTLRQRRHLLLITLVSVILLVAVFLGDRANQQSSLAVAVAKSQRLIDMPSTTLGIPADYFVEADFVESILRSSDGLGKAINAGRLQLVASLPLTAGEARYWKADGCAHLNCVHTTLFEADKGITVEAVVNLTRQQVISSWQNESARPGGSKAILQEALAIAAADPQVTTVLGDIGAADPAMVPMSAWLADNACRDQWCVDLTFLDPAGTGKIFHIFVNLEQAHVARTFFTRGRAERSYSEPLAQGDAFSDNCHEANGWNVCWEMTAHDGLNILDATYEDQEIFSSAKIAQVEAWYPSWPGGYRDEIGFAGTVPPSGNTQVNEFNDGFEVRQVFTEFTRWPNCVCCYRYEQIVRFYNDGRFDLRFVAHGPGCDDLSVYRPFWRIDMALGGPGNDEAWVWENNQWQQLQEETEIHPLVEDVSLEGHKLATFDGPAHYRWSMERTDPLGLDDGRLFVLARNDMEGDGPVLPGPGDTYIPPRQWVDGDSLEDQDLVLWFVPLLHTKKGGPWWCMPDPEPDFSPCEAILKAEPAGELRQPTAEELTTLKATQVPSVPTPTLSAAETQAPVPTPRPIEGEDPHTVILNAGCGSCHKIGSIGEGRKVGPDLTYIGLLAGGRVPDQTAETYVKQSLLLPNAYLAPECPNGPCLPSIMPQNYELRLSDTQIDMIVEFLMAQQGPESTPIPIGEESAAVAPLLDEIPMADDQSATGVIDENSWGDRLPSTAVQILALALVLGLTLFLLLRE